LDPVSGCSSCSCAPCPAVKCLLYCKNGFAVDEKTKCPSCTCNTVPVCDSTSVSLAANTTFCDLNCTKGFVEENGCKKCACLAEVKCICNDADRKSDPIKCNDLKTVSDFSICVRDEKSNICTWTRNLCPIGIELQVKGLIFTNDNLKDFITLYQLNEKEIVYTTEPTKDGNLVVTFWVKGEWVPKDTDSKTVAADVEKSVQSSGTEAYAYVIGTDITSTSVSSTIFVSIVSLIGFLLA